MNPNPSPFSTRLSWIALAALLLFFSTVPLPDPLSAPQLAHLILAMGAFPLIIGAMIYFTPTLTRSAPPEGRVRPLPLLALLIGTTALGAVGYHLDLIILAAPGGIILCGTLLHWMNGRSRRCLGDPHPGLNWYQGALIFLLLGLTSILLAHQWPQGWSSLRSIHQQFNIMGFIGLTAIGTLQVFLPTVGGYSDPNTGTRLKQHLPFAVVGTLFLAAGAADIPYCDLLGKALWLVPLLSLAHPCWKNRQKFNPRSGAAFSLLGALWGFIGLVVTGEATTLPYLFYFFLFPLVTGALSHLLPLWWWPGVPTQKRDDAQRFLGGWGAYRLLGFYGAGLVAIWHHDWGGWIGWVTLLSFAGQLLPIRFLTSPNNRVNTSE
ncbi:MAG: hypothetical protein HQL72_03030 [Magnetococcales bacterium]|nr:hypothetical protein [Magnetococcales bacterium]